MSNLPIIEAAKDELTSIFKDLHRHPEIGFNEHRTAGVVAEKLKEWPQAFMYILISSLLYFLANKVFL